MTIWWLLNRLLFPFSCKHWKRGYDDNDGYEDYDDGRDDDNDDNEDYDDGCDDDNDCYDDDDDGK